MFANPNGFLIFIALILGALLLRSLAIQAVKNRDASPFFILIAGVALVVFMTLTGTKEPETGKVPVVHVANVDVAETGLER